MDIKILTDNGIDVDKGLELLGDMGLYNETMIDFMNELKEKLPKLQSYKGSGDMGNYAILVHSIKSDSKYLGFTKLAELALDHEMKSKENDVNYINENYNSLLAEIGRIVDVCQKYLRK